MPPGRALLHVVGLLLLTCVAADESRAYHGLWGGLFKQQQQQQQQPQQPASTAATAASAALKETLADLHSRLLDRLDSGRSSTSTDNHEDGKQRGSPFSSSSMDALFQEHLNLTLSLLGPHNSSSPLGLPRLHEGLQDALAALDPRKADPQQLATLAAIHGWALGALLATTGGGGTGGASTRSAGSSNTGSALEEVGSGGLEHGGAQRIPDPAWPSFRPHTCLRLQNFGNAEGYSSALFGAAPCSAGAPGNAATSGEALRWGEHASFLLDCSKGGTDSSIGSSEASPSAANSSALRGRLQAVASKAVASVAAALDRSSVCRLALASDSGRGALLEHAFERPLLAGAPQLDALRVRICNMAPSYQQYPAALARGATISLTALKLNGRSLLPPGAALTASQAAAADGCLLQLYRLPGSRPTKGGYVLSGWAHLTEPSSSSMNVGGGGGGGGGAAYGVGEMASLEISLGEYSLLDAATARLLGGSSGAAQAQQLQQEAAAAPAAP